jgi:two-component system, LuxR family, sensor kinase FixL
VSGKKSNSPVDGVFESPSKRPVGTRKPKPLYGNVAAHFARIGAASALPELPRYCLGAGRVIEVGAPATNLWTRQFTRYGVAAAVVLIAYFGGMLLDPWLGERAPFLVFIIPILVSAQFLGRGPALLAASMAMAYGTFSFSKDGTVSTPDLVHLATFAVVSAGILILAHIIESTRAEAVARQHQAEKEAGRSRDLAEALNLLVEGASDYAIFMVDPMGRVMLWNGGAERLFGWLAEEFLGRSAEELYPAAERQRRKMAEDLSAAIEAGIYSAENWQQRKDGTEFLADVTITPLRNPDGSVRGFAKVLRDVTDRHAAAAAVQRRERHLKSILNAIPDAMIVIDAEGRVTSFSPAAEQTFGYDAQELIGQNVSMLMPAPDSERHDDYLRRYLKTGERKIIGIGRVVTGLKKDGSTFPMELAVGEANSDGQRLFTGFIRDLTEKHRTEAQVQELQAELIQVARLSAMGTMASTLAHELNQPLTAIANYAEAVAPVIASESPEDKELLVEIFDEMGAQALRAGSIVRRLREFVARGDTEKSIEDLRTVVNEAAQLGLLGSHEKGVAAKFDLEAITVSVLVDRVQIQQVLINLIRNAVEAMDQSPLRAVRISGSIDGPWARISVTDTGPGLASEVAGQLFQAFISTKSSGMGLGLSICRTIIEAHGGRIGAEAGPEGGTCFWFTLPVGDLDA